MKKISNILWGLVFIVVGVIFGLNAIGLTDINIFFDGWWTLFIIVPCFIDLLKGGDVTGDLIGLVIGVCLFLGCQDFIELKIVWKLIVPIVLVLIGLSIIFKDTLSKTSREIKKINKDGLKEYSACFSGQNLDFNNEEFKGCSLNAVFGSIECNLRNASINEDVVIDASSVFGGITIVVDKDVNVKINSNSIFGGVSDERRTKTNDAKHTVYINASAIFGGVEIK